MFQNSTNNKKIYKNENMRNWMKTHHMIFRVTNYKDALKEKIGKK